MMGIGSQPGSSMKLGFAIRAMVAAEVNWLKQFKNIRENQGERRR
jgi:hypothetical protein